MNSTASNIGHTTQTSISLDAQIIWWLRVAISGCFIGHGMWGLVQKPAWIPFFNSFGITDEIAQNLMPLIGSAESAWCFPRHPEYLFSGFSGRKYRQPVARRSRPCFYHSTARHRPRPARYRPRHAAQASDRESFCGTGAGHGHGCRHV